MATRISRNTSLSRGIRRVQTGVDQGSSSALKSIAPVLIRRIKDRTRSGRNIDGRAFKRRYRPSTVKRKGSSRVDLTDLMAARKEGRTPMLDSLYVDTRGIRKKRQIQIKVRGRKNRQLARITHAKWPWFGLGKKDRNLVQKHLGRTIKRQIAKDRRISYKIVIS